MVVPMSAPAQRCVVGRCPPVDPKRAAEQRIRHGVVQARAPTAQHVPRHVEHSRHADHPAQQPDTPSLGVPLAQGGTRMSHVEVHDLFQNIGTGAQTVNQAHAMLQARGCHIAQGGNDKRLGVQLKARNMHLSQVVDAVLQRADDPDMLARIRNAQAASLKLDASIGKAKCMAAMQRGNMWRVVMHSGCAPYRSNWRQRTGWLQGAIRDTAEGGLSVAGDFLHAVHLVLGIDTHQPAVRHCDEPASWLEKHAEFVEHVNARRVVNRAERRRASAFYGTMYSEGHDALDDLSEEDFYAVLHAPRGSGHGNADAMSAIAATDVCDTISIQANSECHDSEAEDADVDDYPSDMLLTPSSPGNSGAASDGSDAEEDYDGSSASKSASDDSCMECDSDGYRSGEGTLE
jgi:hypothetical protein